MSEHNNAAQQPNDIQLLMDAYDPLMLMKVAMGRITVDEAKDIVQKLGKTLINIGDGLTLLHQAASFNHCELLEWLLSIGHPTEVIL
jgi:hypothetical protein